MNYLFICTQNIHRSPTAEKVFREMLQEKNLPGEVKSARVSPDAPKHINDKLLRWADKIFCMEEEHKTYLSYLLPEIEHKIVVLNIPDRYRRDDPELVRLLRAKLSSEIG